MKIVKTQRRWKLYQEGFPVAIRFDSYADSMRSGIEKLCRERFGNEYYWSGSGGQWRTHWGKASSRFNTRPYFYGFRNEAAISMILLSLPSST